MSSIIGGKKQTQTTRGTTNESFKSSQRSQFRPEDVMALQQSQQESQLAGQNLQNFLKTLQQQSQGEQPFTVGGPDAMTRALASQATQGLAQQAGALQKQVGQQFGANPMAAKALQTQIAMQNRLASNPALFNAFKDQQQRQLQELAARQSQRSEQAGLAQTGYGVSQNALRNAALLADMFKTVLSEGTKTGTQEQQAQSRSGGILQNFGIK